MNASHRRAAPHTAIRNPFLAALSTIVAIGTAIDAARAQDRVDLDDGQGLSVVIGHHGVVSMTRDRQEWRFADVDPLLVRVTRLSGGRMTWSHFTGAQLLQKEPRIEAPTVTRCSVARRDCRLPGISGTFDLVFGGIGGSSCLRWGRTWN